ncbi:hypothetical protein F0562_016175 [Nyssa sinensis]|uniref:Uncharacterized protein n=1 Tax=Nyssa sinensis TaxID=561372 RepID=A0A5J4ZPR3_9ASTE|nr:hypothetical protein F0562_016175 [Nyssa sinensis]
MDFCRNVSVSGSIPSEYPPEPVLSPSYSKLGSLDDLFSGHNTEVDVSLEWLSIFVEDCLSSTGNSLPPAPINLPNTVTGTSTPEPTKPLQFENTQMNTSSLQKFVIPGKARSKRKRGPTAKAKTSWYHHLNQQEQTLQMTSSDPPLLQQAYWLADSELIFPKKEDSSCSPVKDGGAEQEETEEKGMAVVMDDDKDSSGRHWAAAATKTVHPLSSTEDSTVEGRTIGSKDTV